MKHYTQILLAVAIFLIICWPSQLRAQNSQQTDTGGKSFVKRIFDRGVLIAGVKYDAPPFGYRNEAGQLVGFEVDLVRELAARWFGNPNAVEFVQVTSSDRIDRLLAGDIDLIVATMTITLARDEQIDFSQVYFLDGQNILVRSDSGIHNIGDLDGRRVAAVEGSTSIEQIVEYATENGVTVEIIKYNKYTEAVRPLIEGDIDALTTDRGILTGIANTNPGLVLLTDEDFSEEPYGIGLPPGDTILADLVNETLDTIRIDGTYDEIYTRWFESAAPLATVTVIVTATPNAIMTTLQTATPMNISTNTSTPTATLIPTNTPSPTSTEVPTNTPAPTNTTEPTATLTPTERPINTLTPTSTPSETFTTPNTATPTNTVTEVSMTVPAIVTPTVGLPTAVPTPTNTPAPPAYLPLTGGTQTQVTVPIIVTLLSALLLFVVVVWRERRHL